MEEVTGNRWLLDSERKISFECNMPEGGKLPVPLKSREVTTDAISTLNEDQLKAFIEMMEFLQDPEKEYFSLEGYAGTGKTYLLGKVVQCIDGAVAMSAPTNKAVKVLYEHRGIFGDIDEEHTLKVKLGHVDDEDDSHIEDKPNNNVSYATIHKLLALRVQWTRPARGSGKEPEQILVRNYRSTPSVNNYLLLVVDEASMLDDDLFEMIEAEKNKELKVVFMGDPAQIPPVNKVDSIPLIKEQREKYNIQHAILEKIMRQKGDNKILQLAYQVRNGRFQDRDPVMSRISNNDVLFYNSMREKSKQNFIQIMIEHFCSPVFENDPNYSKVIAWTNKMVNTCNEIIRRSIFKVPKLDKVMLGEKLIANKPIFNQEHEIIFSTSDEFIVEEMEVKTAIYFLPKKGNELQSQLEIEIAGTEIKGVKGEEFNFKYYDCYVRYKSSPESEGWLIRIEILHEDSEKAFWFMQKKLKGRRNWDEYTKNIEKYADVKYNYAITCHKAQGSTYENVFLIEDDIDNNRRVLERNRIKYTACTRPSNKLFILSKLNPTQEQQDEYRAKADISDSCGDKQDSPYIEGEIK